MKSYGIPMAVLALGVLVAAMVATLPQAALDLLTWRLWLPYLIPAAAPPVGVTGRTLLALGAIVPFAAAALLAWRLVRAMETRKRRVSSVADAVPTVRRADAHPDAPPRRPIRADADLGPPLPLVTNAEQTGDWEQTLPDDFGARLATFDPVAIPDVPRAPARPVPPLVTIVVPARAQDSEVPAAEKDEPEPWIAAPMYESPSDEPTPPLPEEEAGEEPVAEAAGDHDDGSINGLLDRLERGARRRQAPPPAEPPAAPPGTEQPASLDDTLVMLRQMARR